MNYDLRELLNTTKDKNFNRLKTCILSDKKFAKKYPELARLPKVEVHNGDTLWNHTYHVLLGVKDETLTLKISTLFHDSSKGFKNIRVMNPDGSYSDKNHGEASAEIVEKIMQRDNYEPFMIKDVSWLVAHHMDLHAHAPTWKDPQSWIKKALYQFPRNEWKYRLAVLRKLSLADCCGIKMKLNLKLKNIMN